MPLRPMMNMDDAQLRTSSARRAAGNPSGPTRESAAANDPETAAQSVKAQFKEIRSLTGLCGSAALLVVLYHYSVWDFRETSTVSPIGPGYLAVDLFFILSGFVMALTYGRSFTTGLRLSTYLGFLGKRFARVWPLYGLLTVLFFLVKTMLSHNRPDLGQLTTNLLLIESWGVGLVAPALSYAVLPPAWSISTEAAAYLAFPLFVILGLKRGWFSVFCLVAMSVSGICILSLAPASWTHEGTSRGPLDVSAAVTLWPLVRCLSGFALGLVGYRLYASGYASFQRRWWHDAFLLSILAVFWFVPRSDVVVTGCFLSLVLLISTSESLLARFLSSPIPFVLGEMSYAIYLLHWPALRLQPAVEGALNRVHAPAPHQTAFWIVALGVVGLSWPIFMFVERPARRVIRRFLEGADSIRIESAPAAP